MLQRLRKGGSILNRLALAAGLLLAGSLAAPAQTTVFVVRHADRGAAEPDPALTETGQRQAQALATLLRDARVRHIYTTEFQRTGQTAAPTAREAGVKPEVVRQADLDHLTARVRKSCAAGEAVLIVGHRSTVPRIVKALSDTEIQPLGTSEYDRLVVVTLFPDGKSSVVTLRYGIGGGEGLHESKTRKGL